MIKCLEKVDHITGISAVTEDNDPNGNLNKAGGYTATVYFADDRVPADKVESKGKTIIDKGTDGGGAIEVYANEEDVKKEMIIWQVLMAVFLHQDPIKLSERCL